MASIQHSLAALLTIDGCIAAALVDSNSGLVLGKEGVGIDLDLAGAGDTEVVRAKMKTLASLGIDEPIEDILMTSDSQYSIIRMLRDKDGLFLYLVLDKSRANLALARLKTAQVEKALEF